MLMFLKCSVDIIYAVEEYCRRGTTETKPKDEIRTLNIVLSMAPALDEIALTRTLKMVH